MFFDYNLSLVFMKALKDFFIIRKSNVIIAL